MKKRRLAKAADSREERQAHSDQEPRKANQKSGQMPTPPEKKKLVKEV
jgi:hypothetical protein